MFNEWATPQDFYDAINRRFDFTCDVAALPINTKHENFFTPEINGLVQHWSGVCWMNPPYNNVPGWVAKAWQESRQGTTVVALLASRSSETVWWHNYVMRAKEIWYVKNRLWFSKNGIKSRSNHASVIVVFDPEHDGHPVAGQVDTRGEFINPGLVSQQLFSPSFQMENV